MKMYLFYVLFIGSSIYSSVNGQTGDSAEMKATAMFEALGGKERWAGLRSLYIKATHIEPTLDESYQSEIWRDMDEFKLRIEQQNSTFHNLGLFSDEAGLVHYRHKDSKRELTTEQLVDEKSHHEHNIYVLLKRIALTDRYKSTINGQRLEFSRDGNFEVAFILDEKNRPEIFITRGGDGKEQFSHFDIWHESNGFIHPGGGGPIDGNFRFITEVWEPSSQSFEKAFAVNYQPDED